MQATGISSLKAPGHDRLGLKLALLFAGTFLAVLLLIVVWTLFTNLISSRRGADEADVQSPEFTIDPRIQTDLAKAMAFDAIPASPEVQNPFIDRAGIGTNIAVTPPTVNAAAKVVSGAAPTGTGSSASGTNRITNIPGVRTTLQNATAPEVDNTRARYEDWLTRQRAGYLAGPESETLEVDDLVPVGFADGGDRGVEVILFSISLCRTFSYPVGTRFFNGTLSEIKPQEVVFAVPDGMRRKSYSVERPCGGNNTNTVGVVVQE